MSKSKRLKITEDCIGCVTCETICGKIFELSENGMAIVKTQKEEDFLENEKGIQDAIDLCPTKAIIWESDDEEDK